MKISINNRIEKIDEGFTIDENYNETLDSASIRISHLTTKWDIEPFDNAIIYQDDGETIFRKFCVNNFTCTEEAIGQNDTTYSYSISLFSLTKKLENIILPNLSITPRKIGNKLTIYEYVFHLLFLYCPKHLYNGSYVNDWTISTRFLNKFSSIECTEMQWTTPTLREVINDLTMLQDCIVILNQNEQIDYIDITQTTDVIKPYNYMQETHTSEDYISEIRMELQNVMQTNVENINNVVTTNEFLTFTSDDAIITSENIYLKTQFPILNIKHLWLNILCAKGDIGPQANPSDAALETIVIRQDLCNIRAEYNYEQDYSSLVYEQKEFDSKQALYRNNIFSLSSITDNDGHNIGNYYSIYKNFCLYYTRNSNAILGFNKILKPIFFALETSMLYYLKKIVALNCLKLGIIDDTYGIAVVNGINEPDNNSYFNTYFQIEYETTYNAVFSASKSEKPRNNRVIADNQTNAWVDAYSQGFLEYQKANRLGNLQRMYNQRVTNTNNLYIIGDKINNEDVVYRTEYQIYKDHIECNAHATKNYVLQNYFTGIKSKIRTWINAREEAFIRHDLKKYYCVLSYEQNSDIVENINTNCINFAANLLRTPLWRVSSDNLIKYVLVKTFKDGSNIYFPDANSKYVLNCISRLIGNSIVLTTGFNDNWIVDKHPNTGTRPSDTNYNDNGIIELNNVKGTSIDTQGGFYVPPHFVTNAVGNPIGGIATNYYKYCDENGEFDKIYIYFLDTLNFEGDIATNEEQFVYGLYKLPMLSDNVNNDYKFGIEMPLYKDNKEKPVISTQFEFSSDDNDIKFTKNFLMQQSIIGEQVLTYARVFDENGDIIDENINTSGIFNITPITPYCAKIEFNPYIGIENAKRVEIYNRNSGEIVLSFDVTKTLYLNIRRYY